tara:strand:- start:3700 stop:5085 length:1386 start_codon:yes stop_codon:yes gene_type:complete
MGISPLHTASAAVVAAALCLSGFSFPVFAQAAGKTGAAVPSSTPSSTPRGTRPDGRPEGATGAPAKGRAAGGGRPTFVVVDAVTRSQMTETLPVYGRIIARKAGVVAARVRGAVAEIHADVGTRVSKGDVLIALESDMLTSERDLKTAELAEFRAKTVTARAQLRLAEQELQRIERLRQSAAFSPARLDDKRREVERYRSAVAETAARVQQAVASLNIAEINLANAAIRAPYNGVVTQRHTEAGAYLSIGERVVTMTSDDALEIEAEVPVRRLDGLTPGLRILVDPESTPKFDVTVRAVVPEENQLTRTRTIRFVPAGDTQPELLAAGQSVILHIPSGRPRMVTSAHKDALLHRRGSSVMFVVADGKAAQRKVVLGEAFGDRFEIVSGLAPGDLAVIRGNERLRPGQDVQVRGKDAGSERGRRSGSKPGDRPGGRPGGKPGESATEPAAGGRPIPSSRRAE